jgi:tetratricopeptide (TPR) repeat protein
MEDPQAHYDDAMFDYSTGEYDMALAKLTTILDADPSHFDARLAVAMCHYRKGDFAKAIEEGHRAERLQPNEQLVHTNLSLFYMRSGDKTTAEKHGLQARIAGWKQDLKAPPAAPTPEGEPELQMSQPKPKAFKMPEKFPQMPWKKAGQHSPGSTPSASATPGKGEA